MDCQRVRDQFSSMLEGELSPPEEEKAKEHLASCLECQKDWERFNQMIQWLHSVDEEEVPEGFLSEVERKMEMRRKKVPIPEKEGWRGLHFPRSMKIPIQAAAMVMILFLALYLTKMTPFEMQQEKAVPKTEVSYLVREKKESVLKEEEQSKVTLPPPVSYRKDYISEEKPPVSDERRDAKEGIAQKMKEKDIEPPAPPLKEEMATVKTSRPKEIARAEAPPPEEKRRESDQVRRVMKTLAKKPIREITLKIKDREKAVSRLQDLAKELEGEMVREEENVLLASLPASSYSNFEKGLAELTFSVNSDKTIPTKDAQESLGLQTRTGKREFRKKDKEPQEDFIVIRILLVLE
ncbi:MAG: zf-HC2 domain-containing protein [Thermodesulfobacteriota bacterium]|nr:zf-HC2 domain-containing protein [Thermodesulfobacteriota bacterium]